MGVSGCKLTAMQREKLPNYGFNLKFRNKAANNFSCDGYSIKNVTEGVLS